MELVSSALLAGFPHGFTTRRGGISHPPFDTLNLGGKVGDDPARVASNWEALERVTGLGFARVNQVHGARVIVVDGACAPREEADAILCGAPGVAACVSVADCVPVLIADPRSGAVAAVHAGWRGTLAHAAAHAVRELVRVFGAAPGDLLAAVGPSIGPCCYQVSHDLARAFRDDLGACVTGSRGSGAHLDLWVANETVLRRAGLAAERIEILTRCTACESDAFFSHRRDRGNTGRQVGFIAPAQATRS
jgi:YfiH family protein